MRRSRISAAAATAAVLTLAACGSDGGGDGDAAPTAIGDDATGSNSETVPSVIATTTIWADVTREVACNGLAEVATVIPPGGDPHSFEPSLSDREALGDAVLIVANGLGLEESLEDTIDAVESEGVSVVRVGESIVPLPADDSEHDDDHDETDGEDHETTGDDDHDEDGDDGHDDHGSEDPHIWFDPTRVAATLSAIADGLATAGIDRSALDACVADYTDRLERLDTELQDTVSVLPAEQRLLITNHDSLSYFADRYEFEVLGSVIPSPSSLAATNPGDLEELATLIADTGVPAIFAETQHSSDDTRALAERVGDVEVVTLQTDTLGEPGSDTDNYVDWLTVTTGTIVDALR